MDEKNQNQENLEAVENGTMEEAMSEAPAEPVVEAAPDLNPTPVQKPDPKKKDFDFPGK